MSRIGNRVIVIPEGVTVTEENNEVIVKGPKGELRQVMLKDITMKQEGNEIRLERKNEAAKAMHGTMNSLVERVCFAANFGYTVRLPVFLTSFISCNKYFAIAVSLCLDYALSLCSPLRNVRSPVANVRSAVANVRSAMANIDFVSSKLIIIVLSNKFYGSYPYVFISI